MVESNKRSLVISEEQKRQYVEEGYFIIENVLSDLQIDELREEATRFMSLQDEEMKKNKGGARDINQAGVRYFIANKHKDWDSEILERYIQSQLMAEICRATIGETAYLFHEQYVIKAGEKEPLFHGIKIRDMWVILINRTSPFGLL